MKRGSLNSQPSVAIVDDDLRIRESLESLLESAGVKVRVFPLAEEFLSGDSLATTSCLITDIRMPGMDGLDLQRRVRLLSPELPVIFITAHHDEAAEQRAFAQGATFFFHKPFDADELLRSIKFALSKPVNNHEKVL
jgi:FixJ family two-component response regulator